MHLVFAMHVLLDESFFLSLRFFFVLVFWGWFLYVILGVSCVLRIVFCTGLVILILV